MSQQARENFHINCLWPKGCHIRQYLESVGRGIRISALPVRLALEETHCYIHMFNNNNHILFFKTEYLLHSVF